MIRASLLAIALIAAPAGAQLSGALPGSLTAPRMTAAEAIAAIKAAPAGATIDLRGLQLGDMGTIKPKPGLTLIGGTLSSVVFSGAQGLTWTGYTLRQTPRADAKYRAIRVVGGSVRLIDGAHYGADNAGVQQGRAISLEGGTHLVQGGDFSGGFGSITVAFGAVVTIRDTTHVGYRTTALNGVPGDGSVVEGLVASAPAPVNYGGQGDHGEAVHFWTSGAPIRGLVLRDVRFLQAGGYPTMGVYLDDNSKGLGFRDVLVERMLISSGHSQGLLLENVQGELRSVRMEWTRRGVRGDDPRDAPKIHLKAGTQVRLVDVDMADVVVRADGSGVVR